VADLDPATVVVLDETSTQTVMTRSHGRAPRGARVVGAVPRNHGPNVSCLAALTPAGICAPLVIPGAIDRRVFLPWLREWLLPALPPGTTIVLDNLSVHRSPAVRAAVEAAGCAICPPIPRISIPSSRRSPSSRRTCAGWRPAPTTRW
jgi:hypothetical protein